eukprot:5320069-Pleurochrysis_carterae.AAC.1
MTLARTPAHARTYSHARTHAHARTRTHARTHRRAHTHAHAQGPAQTRTRRAAAQSSALELARGEVAARALSRARAPPRLDAEVVPARLHLAAAGASLVNRQPDLLVQIRRAASNSC